MVLLTSSLVFIDTFSDGHFLVRARLCVLCVYTAAASLLLLATASSRMFDVLTYTWSGPQEVPAHHPPCLASEAAETAGTLGQGTKSHAYKARVGPSSSCFDGTHVMCIVHVWICAREMHLCHYVM